MQVCRSGTQPITGQISKNEFIISQNNEISIFKFNKTKPTKINSFKIKGNIKDLLIINNNLIVSTDEGAIQIFEKNDKNKYLELKKIKFKNNPIYNSLLYLKDNNLICGFTLDYLNIIDIKTAEIISSFKFKQDKKLLQFKNDEHGIITGETFDQRSRPFIIKKPDISNYLICFKLVNYCLVLNYKNMKIIKKINFENSFSFQLFKPEDKYQFFYIIILNKEIENNLIIQKFSSNLKIIEKYVTKFIFPVPEEVKDPDESDEESYLIEDVGDEECIFKCIVKDIKNFVFLYHAYWSPPSEFEIFTLFNYKNGKLYTKKELGYSYFNADDPKKDFEIKEIEKNRVALAKGDGNKGFENIQIVNMK